MNKNAYQNEAPGNFVSDLGPTQTVGAAAIFANLRVVVFNHRTLEPFTIDNDRNTELRSAESDEELGTLPGLHTHITARQENGK
jgi:hypothetical protein